jgi:hypothetical protein
LRQTDRLAALKLLFPIIAKLNWDLNCFDPDWYCYWSGKSGVPLEPFSEGVDFLESQLEVLEKVQAIDGLAAMLGPGEVRRPGGALAERIVELLARVARSNSDSYVRLHALNRMVIRSEPEEAWKIDSREPILLINQAQEIPEYEFPLPSLEEWKKSSRPDAIQRGRGALLALCHLDHLDAIPILTRLLNDPAAQTILKALLAERPRLGPLEMPRRVIVEVEGKPEVRLDPRG